MHPSTGLNKQMRIMPCQFKAKIVTPAVMMFKSLKSSRWFREKLVIVQTKWDGLAPALQSGKIDAIIAGMSPTAERRKEIDFTDPYYESQLVVVVQKIANMQKQKFSRSFWSKDHCSVKYIPLYCDRSDTRCAETTSNG